MERVSQGTQKMINCDICNRMVEAVTLQGPIHNIMRYCDTCWYDKNPPIMVLTKLWYSPHYGDVNSESELSNLFNPKMNKRVYPVKGQMDKCGFRLFNRKVFFNQKSNEKYKEVLIFKYSGNLRCLALKEYGAWPSHMKQCDKIGCYLY